VPFEDCINPVSGDGSIHREDKEISPRYNGHKVTIQVNRTSPDFLSSPSQTGFKSKQISSHQVTKKYVSSSVRKVNSGDDERSSSHSMLLTKHSINNTQEAQGEVQNMEQFEEIRTKDGRVVSHHQEFQQSTVPQMVPVYSSSSPNPSSARENRNSRSSRSSASEFMDSKRETFFLKTSSGGRKYF